MCNEQNNCCGTTCDKQVVADYIKTLELRVENFAKLTEATAELIGIYETRDIPPQTTYQLCDRVDTTRKALNEMIDNAPGALYFDLNELSGGWITADEFKAKHGDVEL